MKKILSLAILLAISLVGNAETTSDVFTITPRSTSVLLEPGNGKTTFFVTFGIDATSSGVYYTGYQLDIILPEGVDVLLKNEEYASLRDDDGVYPSFRPIKNQDEVDEEDAEPIYGDPQYTHSVQSNIVTREDGDRALRIGCMSTRSEVFTKLSGSLFRVYFQASTFAKPQSDALTIKDAAFITSQAVKFNSPEVSGVDIQASAYASINISSANKWSTCILPFDYTPSGFTAYNASETSTDNDITYVNLTVASTMEAYKPYIVYAEAGFSNTLSGTVNPANYPDDQNGLVENGLLKGTIVPTSINSGYVLQNQGDGAMFYNVNNRTFSIPAGKCWMELPTLSNAPSRIVMTTNEATALENVSVEAASSAIYTVTGQLVSEPIPGNIYILKGKKVLIVK